MSSPFAHRPMSNPVKRVLVLNVLLLLVISLMNPAIAGETHSDVTTVGGISAGLASVAGTLFTWGFGAPLQASILIHTGAAWCLDKSSSSKAQGGTVRFLPDTSFNSLSPVVVPTAPIVSTDNLIAPEDIDDANELLQHMARMAGYLRAMNITLNRLYTAISAGNAGAANLQRSYIIGELIPAIQDSAQAADGELIEILSGFQDLTITSAQVETFVQGVNSMGLPPEETALFKLMKASLAEQVEARHILNTPDFASQPVYSLAVDGIGKTRELLQTTVAFVQTLDLNPTVVLPETQTPVGEITASGINSEGKQFVEVTIQQSEGHGIAGVSMIRGANVKVSVPEFPEYTNEPIIATATRADGSQSASVEFGACNSVCNCTKVDPVLAQLHIPATGNQTRERFAEIPTAEHWVTIQNGEPGIRKAKVLVNGRVAAVRWMRDGDIRVLDVAAWMTASQNVITVVANGRPGSSALLFISDVPGPVADPAESTHGFWSQGMNLHWGR